jgi:hypothetical protein
MVQEVRWTGESDGGGGAVGRAVRVGRVVQSGGWSGWGVWWRGSDWRLGRD